MFKRLGLKFRTRNVTRDLATDRLRFGKLRAAIEDAYLGAARERAGLSRRLASETERAAFLYENLDPENEQSMRSCEQDILYSQRRIRDLEAQVAKLAEIRDLALSVSDKFERSVNSETVAEVTQVN